MGTDHDVHSPSVAAPSGDRSFTELTTQRLSLRRVSPFDADAIAAYRGLPQVARYQGWVSFDAVDARNLVEDMRDRHPGEPGRWMQLVIEPRGRRGLLGDIGLIVPPDEHEVLELGITLAPHAQGQGFAFEGLAAVIAYAHRKLGTEVARAVVDWRNTRSLALFARLGMSEVLSLPVEAKGEPTRDLVLEARVDQTLLASLGV